MPELRREIADVLRGRVLRGLRAGALRLGDRLPTARELAAEFDVDHRVVLDAYRVLVSEGLIELRPRGGIYVTGAEGGGSGPLPSHAWLAELLSEGLTREVPIVELHEWLRRAVETRRLRAVAVETSADQIAGLCGELEDDYGLACSGLDAAGLGDGTTHPPPELRAADLVVTTRGLENLVAPTARRLGKRLIAVDLRADLIGGEWRLFLRHPVYVVVEDERFAATLLQFFAHTPGVENIHPLVAGRDDLTRIPDGAPVYVTRSARLRVGDARVGGRLLPAARLFSAESSREIIHFIVGANLAAVAATRHV